MNIKPTDRYWVQWRSYNPKEGGYCTHAVEIDAQTNRALCGVVADDGAGLTLTQTDGRLGCRRCQKSLVKRGVIPSIT